MATASLTSVRRSSIADLDVDTLAALIADAHAYPRRVATVNLDAPAAVPAQRGALSVSQQLAVVFAAAEQD